jgi:hypothetical protein
VVVRWPGHSRGHTNSVETHDEYVTVHPPKPQAAERLKESLSWLENSADQVVIVHDVAALPGALECALSSKAKRAG